MKSINFQFTEETTTEIVEQRGKIWYKLVGSRGESVYCVRRAEIERRTAVLKGRVEEGGC